VKKIKIDWKLAGVVAAGILLRIGLSPLAFHSDIITQAGWGKWIYENGVKGFYENNIWIYGWPTQPPIINWMYGVSFSVYNWLYTLFIVGGSFIANHHLGAGHLRWFYQFVEWWGNVKYSETPFKIGELISMKLWLIGGDAILAYLIYKIVKIKTNINRARLAAMVYLFSPFSWYESALWGQHDQVGLIFLLAAFWLLTKKKGGWVAPIMLMISILIKPTAFIFSPLFVWIAVGGKKSVKQVIGGSVLALVGYFWIVRMFSALNFWQFNINLQRIVFVKGEMWTWLNTFNLWRIITGYLTDYRQLFLGISLKTWGYLMFLGVNILAFKISRKRDGEGVLKAVFIVALGGWMTMVTMHERYLFPAVVAGLILAAENLKLMKYWVALSLVFAINMFTGWWWPESLGWLKNILIWGGNDLDGPVPKILSGINLVLMIVMIKILFEKTGKDKVKN
jgi:Gpi18-like mannosyltransferase